MFDRLYPFVFTPVFVPKPVSTFGKQAILCEMACALARPLPAFPHAPFHRQDNATQRFLNRDCLSSAQTMLSLAHNRAQAYARPVHQLQHVEDFWIWQNLWPDSSKLQNEETGNPPDIPNADRTNTHRR